MTVAIQTLTYLSVSTIWVSSDDFSSIIWGIFRLDRIPSLGSNKPIIFKDQAHNTEKKY